MKVNTASGFSEAILESSTWKSGLVIRDHEVDALVAAILRHLAKDLVALVVLVGGHIEERAAVLAGVARRSGIRADQEGLGIRHRLVDRLEDIGEDWSHDKIDLVAFEQAFDFRDRAVRFQFVIGCHDLYLPAGHLAAEVLDRECEAVADLLAERRRRTRQCHDQADLELFLRDRRIGNEPKQGRQASQLQPLFHDILLIGCNAAEVHPDTASAFAPAAYSDDGARGKQSSRKPEAIVKARHARQCSNMQGARQLFEP
jgi:hypothetical protein